MLCVSAQRLVGLSGHTDALIAIERFMYSAPLPGFQGYRTVESALRRRRRRGADGIQLIAPLPGFVAGSAAAYLPLPEHIGHLACCNSFGKPPPTPHQAHAGSHPDLISILPDLISNNSKTLTQVLLLRPHTSAYSALREPDTLFDP